MTPTNTINRLLAALVALALVLGGLLAIAEIVLGRLGRPFWFIPRQQWGNWVTRQTWDATLVRLILAGMLLAGLLLLLAGLRRGRPRLLPVASEAPGVQFDVVRRGAEHDVVAAARRTNGVRSASASIGRSKATVRAKTDARSTGDIPQQTSAAITARLADLGLDGLRPRVKVKGKKR